MSTRTLRIVATAAALTMSAAGSSLQLSVCSPLTTRLDSASLACTPCGSSIDNKVPANTSVNVLGSAESCTCARGFSASPAACDVTLSAICAADACSPCSRFGANFTSLQSNGTACVPCGNSTLGVGSSGDCSCFLGPTGSLALVETTVTGAVAAFKSCVLCPARSRVFTAAVGGWPADPYTCARCSDPWATLTPTGACVCDAGYVATGVSGVGSSRAVPGAATACIASSVATYISATAPETSAILVNFPSITAAGGGGTTSLTSRPSVFIQHYYLRAAAGCAAYRSGGTAGACQSLANLCVMQLYSPSSTACKLLATLSAARAGSINGFTNWVASLPFTLYTTTAAVTTSDQALARVMSFDASVESGTSDTVQLILVKFALNGTFLGVERLTNQLIYCGAGSSSALPDAPAWLRFGYAFTGAYNCALRSLLAGGAEPIFYDLYIRDLAADGVSGVNTLVGNSVTLPMTLYPVPVRIVNYVSSDGSAPNRNSGTGDEANDVLTRRFTLYDTVSGVTTSGGTPEVIRYASSISLSFPTRRDGNSRPNLLNPPVLTITYSERLYGPMVGDDAGYGTDVLTFNVEYVSEQTTYNSNIMSVATALGIVTAMYAVARVVAWTRMNARNQFESSLSLRHLGMWLLITATSAAMAYFWFAWTVSMYWLVFFKLQTAVHVLLPAWRPTYRDSDYLTFDAGVIVLFVAFLLRVGMQIWNQVRADIFFLDWEKPRGAVLRTGQDHEAALGKMVAAGLPGAIASTNKFAPTSVWRTIHIANEWAKLSTARRVNLPLSLLALVVILHAGGAQYVATPRPGLKDLTPGSLNPLLQFANTIFWWLIIVAVQALYLLVAGERFVGENPSSRFIDVCTISKISVFLMDAKYHGYYIHGNAPHEHADGDMRELADHLFEEAASMRHGRGLPGCTDPACQTFELHVPALWREQYDRVYRRLVDSESAAVETMAQNAAMARVGGAGMAAGGAAMMPQSLTATSHLARAKERTRRLHAAFQALGAFLRGFIEETDADYKRVWRERTLWQQIFDMPPDMITEGMMGVATGAASGGPGGGRVTYTMLDRGYRFERLIFRGMELDLLIMDILTFCLVYRWSGQPTSAAIATFIVAEVLARARVWLGNRNTSYKTLVDERFLH